MSTSKLCRRAANYSKAELDCILDYLDENPDLVNLRIGGQYETHDDIRLAWEELSARVTAIAGFYGTRRTGQEVKRKWADLKSRVKAKAATLAIEAENPGSITPNMKLTAFEERALEIISRDTELLPKKSDISVQRSIIPSLKVFSFQNDSNSADRIESEFGEEGTTSHTIVDESGILQEIKSSGSEDKKRRISEAFSADKKNLKKLKIVSEEEQLQELCNSQQEMNNELHNIKDILKKCQLSIEKIALLKRAELRLKCAKYGVEFADLFD